MRRIIKKQSTKAERIFYEVLKEQHIPFKHRWLIGGMEVDFVIGQYAIEIDGHLQDGHKNERLRDLDYTPIHFNNKEILCNKEIINIWLEQIILRP